MREGSRADTLSKINSYDRKLMPNELYFPYIDVYILKISISHCQNYEPPGSQAGCQLPPLCNTLLAEEHFCSASYYVKRAVNRQPGYRSGDP